MSLRDRMTRLDGELVEAREVLERVAPGEPRVQAPATVAEALPSRTPRRLLRRRKTSPACFATKRTSTRAPNAARAGARAATPARASRAPPDDRSLHEETAFAFFRATAFSFSPFRPASAAASASASRAVSDLTRPFHLPRPSMRCSRSTRGPGRRQGEERTRPRGGVTWTLPAGAPRLARRARRAGGTTTPTCACRRSAGSTSSFRGRLETPRRVAGGVRPAAPTAASAPPPSSSRHRRRPSPSAFRACPPSSARPSHLAGRPRRDAPRFTRVTRGGARESTALPGAHPTRPGAGKRSPRLRSPRRRAARRRAATCSRCCPRRGRGAFSARVAFEEDERRGGRRSRRRRARARARWTPSRRGCARACDAKAPERKRLPKTSKDASSKDAPREEGDVAAGLRRWLMTTPPRRRRRCATRAPRRRFRRRRPRRRPVRAAAPVSARGVRRDRRTRTAWCTWRASGRRARLDAAPDRHEGLAPPRRRRPDTRGRRARPGRRRRRGAAQTRAAHPAAPPPRPAWRSRRPRAARGDATFPVSSRRGAGPRGSAGAAKAAEPAAQAPATAEEKASSSCGRRASASAATCRTVSSARLDETRRPCMSMLFDRHLAGLGGGRAAQRRAADAVDPALARVARARGGRPRPPWRRRRQGEGKKRASAAGGGGGPWGRCAVAVQKKGRCGTDTAPARCLRRGGRGRGRAGGPLDDASEPPEFSRDDLSASKAGARSRRRGCAGPSAAAPAPARRPPPTPLPRLPPQRSRHAAERRESAARRRRAATRGKRAREGRRREPRAFPRVFVVVVVRVRVGERAGIGGGGAGEPLGGVGRGPGATRGGAARRGGGGDAGAAVRADVAAAGEQARDHVPARARAGRRGRGGRALCGGGGRARRGRRACPRRARCAGS